jgi:hypothetical protein
MTSSNKNEDTLIIIEEHINVPPINTTAARRKIRIYGTLMGISMLLTLLCLIFIWIFGNKTIIAVANLLAGAELIVIVMISASLMVKSMYLDHTPR